MREIKCPHDLNQFLLGKPIFENPFPKEECEQRKFYGDCYHCFSTSIARRDHQLKYNAIEEEVDKAIEAMDQATWIPCSKRLPKKSGNYWCTFGGTNLTGKDYYTTESDAKEIFDDAAEEYVGWQSQNVIAWMPIPKSYRTKRTINHADKEESESKNDKRSDK